MRNELYHHGIKGQRWGVRRYQNKDGSLTAKGKKHYKDGDYTFSKGSTQSHISTKEKIHMKNRSTFTMTSDNDMRIYGGTYGRSLAKGKDPKIYAHVFKNKHSGVIAGEKAMRDTYDYIYTKYNYLMIDSMRLGYNSYLKRGQIKGNTPYNEFSKDKDRMFKLFTKTTLNWYSSRDSKGTTKEMPPKLCIIGKMYTENLQKQKYAGMLDLNDKGTWYGAESPTIIFNGKKYLKDTGAINLPLSAIRNMTITLIEEGRRNDQTTELF